MKDYTCKIVECSKELSVKEKIKVKDLTNAISIDSVVTDDTPLVISPDFYVVLDVHNERSKDKDYKKYVIFDKAGNKYTTGSDSFMNAFTGIYAEMLEAYGSADNFEDFSIEVYRKPSKNYAGKSFLSCSIM